MEREIRFSRLYEKKAEVLGELYRRIARAEKAFAEYTNVFQLGGEEAHEKRGQLAAQRGNEFFEYLNEIDLYLDASLAQQMRDIWGTFRRAWSDFIPKPRGLDWHTAYEAYQTSAPRIRQAIRQEMQRILEGRQEEGRGDGGESA